MNIFLLLGGGCSRFRFAPAVQPLGIPRVQAVSAAEDKKGPRQQHHGDAIRSFAHLGASPLRELAGAGDVVAHLALRLEPLEATHDVQAFFKPSLTNSDDEVLRLHGPVWG